MNILNKITKYFRRNEHPVATTFSSASNVYGRYIERFLELKFEKDLKKLNRRSSQVLRYKYKDMTTLGVPINGYKFVVQWRPIAYVIPKIYK